MISSWRYVSNFIFVQAPVYLFIQSISWFCTMGVCLLTQGGGRGHSGQGYLSFAAPTNLCWWPQVIMLPVTTNTGNV